MGVWDYIKSFFTATPTQGGGGGDGSGNFFTSLFSGMGGFTKIIMLVIVLGVVVFLIYEGIQIFVAYQNQMFKFAILEQIGGLAKRGFEKIIDGTENVAEKVERGTEDVARGVENKVEETTDGLKDEVARTDE